jgi:hypothetical protein
MKKSETLQRPLEPENTYRKPPVILKMVLEAGIDTFFGENRPIAEKQSGREEKLDESDAVPEQNSN